MLEHGERMWEFAGTYAATRARMGLPAVQIEDIMYARAVELVTERLRRVDLLTSRGVAAAVWSTKAVTWREGKRLQIEGLVKALVTHVSRNGARLGVNAEIENQARSHRGKVCLPVESLVVQLAMQEVIESVPTSRLTIEDARSAARVAKLRIVVSFKAGRGAADDRIHRSPIA